MRDMQEHHQDERVGEDNDEEGVDENGYPLYGREVEMYDEAAALLQRRYNPCWMASWGWVIIINTRIMVFINGSLWDTRLS